MATKKKADNIDYKEICEFYEHLLDHKNLDIEFLSDENEVLKKSLSGKDRFASKQKEKIEQLTKELSFALREKSALGYSGECLREVNSDLLDKVNSIKIDRLSLTILSLFLVCVIIFVK